MRFSQKFWQNKKGNGNSNLHAKLQAYFLSNIFVIGKIRIMEFHQPPSTENFDNSPYPYGTPKFRFIFVKRCVRRLV